LLQTESREKRVTRSCLALLAGKRRRDKIFYIVEQRAWYPNACYKNVNLE